LRVLRLPGIAFGKPLSAQNVARHWLWNERASQYAITLRFAPRSVAFARKTPLKRVYTGYGMNSGFQPVTGLTRLPQRAAFVRFEIRKLFNSRRQSLTTPTKDV